MCLGQMEVLPLEQRRFYHLPELSVGELRDASILERVLVPEESFLITGSANPQLIGKGVPDIVVGYCGQNYLFEIKDGDKLPSQQKLTPMEVTFFETWKGQVKVATCLDDILNEIRL